MSKSIVMLSDYTQEQEKNLLALVAANSESSFGREHNFTKIFSFAEFQKSVPIRNYEGFKPYICRVKNGEERVLCTEPILRFHLSSGTSSSAKLIPFTSGLRDEFQGAVRIWLSSLFDCYPEILNGPNFFVISPYFSVDTFSQEQASQIPIGFDSDLDYLPKELQKWFVETTVLPDSIGKVTEISDYQRLTALYLLQAHDLRLFFFWSPTYLTTLLEYIAQNRASLLNDLRNASEVISILSSKYNVHLPIKPFEKSSERIYDLENYFSHTEPVWEAIWPKLSLISCWADGWAKTFLSAISRAFPNVPVQGKGLIATEGIVSVPIISQGLPGSSILSNAHVFEFLDNESGVTFLPSQLEQNKIYEVIMTTSGGLYRYRLYDLVRIEGFIDGIPKLEFVGKSNFVSDLCGEKLNALHVERLIKKTLSKQSVNSSLTFLAPTITNNQPGYALFIESSYSNKIDFVLAGVERELCKNFHYLHCRSIGQLAPLKAFIVDKTAAKIYFGIKASKSRLSTAKWSFLERDSGWENHLSLQIVAELSL